MLATRITRLVDRITDEGPVREAARRIPGLEARLDEALMRMDRVFLGLNFIQLVQDPTRTDRLFEVLDPSPAQKKRYQAYTDRIIGRIFADADVARLYEEKYLPPLADIEVLRDFEPGTLGRAFADHIIGNGLDVDFFPTVVVDDRFSWFELRARQVHDIWHVLTGYDTTVPGEIALQAFTYGQWRAPLTAVLVAGGFFNLALGGQLEGLEQAFNGAVDGYNAGKAAKSLLGIPLEEYWGESVEEVRRLCGLPVHGVA